MPKTSIDSLEYDKKIIVDEQGNIDLKVNLVDLEMICEALRSREKELKKRLISPSRKEKFKEEWREEIIYIVPLRKRLERRFEYND